MREQQSDYMCENERNVCREKGKPSTVSVIFNITAIYDEVR
jgi:hypothetical protein